jgi:hypothetical protein
MVEKCRKSGIMDIRNNVFTVVVPYLEELDTILLYSFQNELSVIPSCTLPRRD